MWKFFWYNKRVAVVSFPGIICLYSFKYHILTSIECKKLGPKKTSYTTTFFSSTCWAHLLDNNSRFSVGKVAYCSVELLHKYEIITIFSLVEAMKKSKFGNGVICCRQCTKVG